MELLGNTYAIQISIGEETCTASKNRPHALVEALVSILKVRASIDLRVRLFHALALHQIIDDTRHLDNAAATSRSRE